MSRFSTKRVYDAPGRGDGRRVLVDRLWPRGLAKDKALVDDWLKEIAPSDGLRKWFGHKPELWPEFRKRFARELAANAEAVERLRAMGREGHVTLLFAAKDATHNNAVALKDYLDGKLRASDVR